MHRFSVYHFSDKEIDQIVSLVHEWSGGRILPIDKRHYNKQVCTYAQRWGLLEQRGDGRYYLGSEISRFNPIQDTPPEVLWRLVEPMLQGQRIIGFSITKDARWEQLNIWPQGRQFACEQSLGEQYDTLHRLAQYGYILFQHAGSIWEITRCDAAA